MFTLSLFVIVCIMYGVLFVIVCVMYGTWHRPWHSKT